MVCSREQSIKNFGTGMTGKTHTSQWKKLMSDKMTGRGITKEQRKKTSKTNKDKNISPPEKFWIKKGDVAWNKGEENQLWSKENNPNWRGGVTPEIRLLRNSSKYKIWREMVFLRDDFTCQECGKRGCYLEAHHIKQFALYPELRFNINNGVSLCIECHMKIDEYRRRFKIPMEVII